MNMKIKRNSFVTNSPPVQTGDWHTKFQIVCSSNNHVKKKIMSKCEKNWHGKDMFNNARLNVMLLYGFSKANEEKLMKIIHLSGWEI